MDRVILGGGVSVTVVVCLLADGGGDDCVGVARRGS